MLEREKEMSYPYILGKNENFLADYSLCQSVKHDFNVSGRFQFNRNFNIKMLNCLSNLDNYDNQIITNKLYNKIKSKHNNKSHELVLGPGVNGILQNIINLYFDDKSKNFVTPFFTFKQPLYALSKTKNEIRLTLLNQEFDLNFENIKRSINKDTQIVFICNPNNPTGIYEDCKKIIKLAKSVSCLVVVSEAGIAFTKKQSLLDFENLPNNLIVLRSFSKEYGLSGIRLGYGYLPSKVYKQYLKYTYTNQVSLIAKIIANNIYDSKFIPKNINIVCKERDKLQQSLMGMGIPVTNSESNTVMISKPLNSQVFEELLKNNIIVTKVDGINGELYARIAINKKHENNFLLKRLKAIKEEFNENFFSN